MLEDPAGFNRLLDTAMEQFAAPQRVNRRLNLKP
jgi:hypothetical protein